MKVATNTQTDFRKLRAKGIGASEVGSVIGVNPYQTPYQLWQAKTGRIPHFEGNKFTRAGHMLEPVIVQYFEEESGIKVNEGEEGNVTVFHPNHEYIFCTPDRTYEREGRRGALECKSTQKRIMDISSELSWQAQNQYQIGILGYQEGAIAWLERGLDFYLEFNEFNREFFDAVVNEIGEFWHKYVLSDIPPPPINSEDILKMYDMVPGKQIIATDETYDAYLKLKNVREQLKNLKAEKEQLEEQFKMIMKDAESVVHADDTLVTWKQNTTTRLNQSALKKEQAALYEYYAYESKQRRFLVK